MRNALCPPGAIGLPILAAVVVLSCTDSDNPTALSELAPETEFEFSVTRVETFEEVEIHVHVMDGGAPLHMTSAKIEIEPESGGLPRTISMEPDGDRFSAHVIFYESGEHHLHLMGTAEDHRLEMQMGEIEIDVYRQHREIGPYWVELGAAPAPLTEGTSAHLHFFVYERDASGEPGELVGGLSLGCAVHDLAGSETELSMIEEEPGTHETEYRFGPAGMYKLHSEIETGTEHLHGDFHITVVAEAADEDPDGGDGGGHGH